MRILHLTPYYAPAYAFGGVVRSVEGMATALAQRGHEVTVLTTDALDHKRRYTGKPDEIIDGVRVVRRPNILLGLRGRFNLSTPRSMKRTAEAILPTIDVLHIHEFRTLENLMVTPAAGRLAVPIALSPHGTLNLTTGRGALKSAWDRLLSPGIAQRIDQVVALSEAERIEAEALWKRFGARRKPARFSVIPNGVDLGDFDRQALAASFRKRYHLGDALTLLFMGRLQARKGVDVLIKAFKAADIEDSRICSSWDPTRACCPPCKRSRTATGALFSPATSKAMRGWARLAASEIFALPATGEGQPMAALEAMAAALAGCAVAGLQSAWSR